MTRGGASGRTAFPVRLMMRQEALLVVLVVVLLVAVVSIQPSFWHVETLFNVLRDSLVTTLFALGVLIVLVAGGIDVSFIAIGVFAGYTTIKTFPEELPGGWLSYFVVAAVIGALLGLGNALVVLLARTSTLIATLATSAIIAGAMVAYVGGNVISLLPDTLTALSNRQLVTMDAQVRGTTSLNVLVLLVAGACVLMALLLRYTVFGRTLYAVGGDEEAARRAGVNVTWTRVGAFALSGALYGLAGIVHMTLSRRADPTSFTGGELSILAAVVLGGVLITGGRGTVFGVVLGVLLVSLIKASLIPLHVPSIWQGATIGGLLLLGVLVQTLSERSKPTRPILDETPVHLPPAEVPPAEAPTTPAPAGQTAGQTEAVGLDKRRDHDHA